jgi:hypothetical protein
MPKSLDNNCYGQWQDSIRNMIYPLTSNRNLIVSEWFEEVKKVSESCKGPKLGFSVTEVTCASHRGVYFTKKSCLKHECVFGDKFSCYEDAGRDPKLTGYEANLNTLKKSSVSKNPVRMMDVLTWSSSAWALVTLSQFNRADTLGLNMKVKGVDKNVVIADSGQFCNSPIQKYLNDGGDKVVISFDYSDESDLIKPFQNCVDFHGLKGFRTQCGGIKGEKLTYQKCNGKNVLYIKGHINNHPWYMIPMRDVDGNQISKEFPTITKYRKRINYFKTNEEIIHTMNRLNLFYDVIISSLFK